MVFAAENTCLAPLGADGLGQEEEESCECKAGSNTGLCGTSLVWFVLGLTLKAGTIQYTERGTHHVRSVLFSKCSALQVDTAT